MTHPIKDKRCSSCGKIKLLPEFNSDKTKPWASADKTNIQLLCPPCNSRKNAKDPLDFMQSNGCLL